jgi:release factor glutamine methyltransferase
MIAAALARATERLTAAGIDSARLDARVLLAHAMGIAPGELHFATYPLRPPSLRSASTFPAEAGEDNKAQSSGIEPHLSSPVYGGGAERSDGGGGNSESLALFEQFIARRISREPVAYITGTKGFWTLDFDIGPGALVPRPDTETLIEQALAEFPDKSAPLRALDLGAGPGTILLSFLSEYPQARGVGVERSAEALAWAVRNAAKFGFSGRAELLHADWSATPATTFDAVFSNPPYITQTESLSAQAELGFEPREALVGGNDGLDAYRALAPLVSSRLEPGGRAFLEIGQGQSEAVTAILAASGLQTVRIAPDLAGIPRCIVARLEKSLGMERASG